MPKKHTTKITDILKRDIRWYDFKNMPSAERARYVAAAKLLLSNPVLINEIAVAIKDFKDFAYNSATNMEEVRNMRYSGNGLKALIERLEEIAAFKDGVDEHEEEPNVDEM